jgi:hypothetical protein
MTDAQEKEGATKPPIQSLGGTSPERAFVLGLIPGVGALYNAEYFKAAVHLLIFGTLTTIVDEARVAQTLLGFLAFGFYAYMPFEAYYTAKKRKLAAEGIHLETPFDGFNEQIGRIKDKELWGGVALIFIGMLFLLDNFDIIRIGNVAKLWPVILIVIGVWLMRSFLQKGRA